MSEFLRDLRRSLLILIASAALGFFVHAASPRRMDVLSADGPGAWSYRATRITARNLKALLAQGSAALILDLRSHEEFGAGHPRDAIHVPWEEFMKIYSTSSLPSLLRSARVVVLLCGSDQCPVADRAARRLADLGHPQVKVLENGWKGYLESGLEISR